MPTASMHFSGPWPPVISFRYCEHVVDLAAVEDLRARVRASSSRSSTSSMAITRLAPSTMADWMANSPTGPQPQTATVSSGLMSAWTAACQPVGRMSDEEDVRSSARPGHFTAVVAANGTRRYSAWPPA